MRRKRQSRNRPDVHLNTMGRKYGATRQKFCRWIEISSLRHCHHPLTAMAVERERERKNSTELFLLFPRAKREP